jgi:CubicO group peptidase (beta-lactamase class C family)
MRPDRYQPSARGRLASSRRSILRTKGLHILQCFLASVLITTMGMTACDAASFLPSGTDHGSFSSGGLDRVTAMLDAEVAHGNIPGAIVLIQQRGKPVYYQGFGFRDPQTKAPMTEDAIFRLYSMTKPVTSVAAMMLVEDGKLSLKDPVSKYIPSIANMKVGVEKTGPDGRRWLDLVPVRRPITVLDLMRQSSGIISTFIELGPVTDRYLNAGLFDGDFDNREFVARLSKLPLAYQPGTVWDYGYSTDVLGRVIEIASGQSLFAFEKQRIFDPLRMPDTAYYITDPQRKARLTQPLPHDRIIGKEPISDPTISRKWESGGSGLVSTAQDFARFLQMLVNGGTLDGQRYLTADSVRLMQRNEVAPATDVKPWSYYFPGAGFGYGMGFGVRVAPGEDGVPGYLGELAWGGAAGTYFWAYPEQDMVMLFMVQTPTQRGRIQPVLKTLIYDAILKPQPAAPGSGSGLASRADQSDPAYSAGPLVSAYVDGAPAGGD